MKTKHLTRSHAMREATSPPRTPTPRSDRNTDFNGSNSNDIAITDSKMHLQSSPTKLMDCGGMPPPVIVTSQNQCQTGDNIGNNGTVICEADFPKLTPPKSSKNARNINTNPKDQQNHQNNNNTCRDMSSNRSDNSNSSSKSDVLLSPPKGGYTNNNNNNKSSDNGKPNGSSDYTQMISSNDPLATPPRNDSQNSFTVDENQNDTGGRGSSSSSSTHSSAGPKKFHKLNTPNSTANSKGSKPRLKNLGSSSSCEGVNSNSNSTSGFISRDSSTEQFTDSNGVDLIEFFKETLNKNIKDRNTLLQIEEDLIDLVDEKSRREMRFPGASSYHRMLIHRTAAFFGMDHNVDSETQTCVIVSKTRSTRIPEIRFNTLLCRELLNDDQPPRKSILKRDAHSFDDPRQGFLCPERMMLDRKAKSFEEREEEYEKARTRIFRNRENDDSYWSWHHDKSDQISRLRQNKMLKVKSMSTDSRDQRPSVSKANSFGGYGGPPSSNNGSLNRGNSMNMSKSAGSRYISKQDSVGSNNTPWRMSPSSSGYKTQTQSLRSESATPSPSGSGSCDDDITPEPPSSPLHKSGGIMWAVSDMASVPKGSVLIDPYTLQPVVNRDGSIYHYDPSNLPPSQVLAPGTYNTNNNKNKLQAKKPLENTSCNNNLINNNMNSKKMISSSTSTNAAAPDINSNETDNATLSSDTVDSSENTHTTAGCSVQTIITTVTNSCNTSISEDTKDKNEESDNEQLPEKSTLHVTAEFYPAEKPLVKNQATSPKIPTPDPDEKLSEGCDHLSETKTSTPASSTPVQQDVRKDDQHNSQSHQPVVKSSNIPIMSFAPPASYQIDGTTIYPQSNPPGSGAYPGTTYQQGADGNLYAVPPSMVYAYPPPMDGEVQGYFMSVYDPTGTTAVAAQTPGTPGQATLYQPGGPTVVPVAAYTSAPFPGAQFYQGPVIYSTEQFPPPGSTVSAAGSQSSSNNATQAATPATPTGQIPQYPLTTYPISYTYPTSGYWGQPMTYYVPQQALTNTPSGVLAHTPHAQSQNVDSQKGVNNNSSGGSGGTTMNGKKRSTPPHNSSSQLHQSNHHQTNSHPATPVTANTTYQFASAVPLALTPATDINGQPMYAAIPAPHTFPTNILPYAPSSSTPQTPPSSAAAGSTTSASLGVLTPITPHPTNSTHNTSSPSSNQTVINSLVPTTSSSTTSSPTSSSSTSTSYKNIQSTPSTPISTTTTSTSYMGNRSNQPLFPTPPILVAANNGYHPHHYYDMSVEKRNSHTGKRNSNGYVPNGRQHSYASTAPPNSSHQIRKQSSIDSASSMNNHRSNQQPKRLPMSNNSSNVGNHSSSEGKPRMMNSGGIYRQQKPSSLDFKKNGFSYNNNNNGQSQRNTPSTNSVESGSPNSLVSSMNGSTVASNAAGQFVAPGTFVATEYHLSGGHHGTPHHQTPATFYMATATRGAHIPSSVHHAPNSASVVAAEVANAACHQQMIGAYNPHHTSHHPHNGAGMYFKYGQPYFAPTMALPNNRRSPPSEMRPSMTPLTGVFPAVNMMIQAPRQLQPRHPNPNYKGNKTR